MNLHEWDVCAGLLIAAETGCTAGYFRNDRNISLCVSAPQLFNQIFKELEN